MKVQIEVHISAFHVVQEYLKNDAEKPVIQLLEKDGIGNNLKKEQVSR